MSAASIERADRGLIFAWDRLRRIPIILPGFLLISFVGHIGAFFLFRVVYPPQASLPMPPPTITVLDPSRPDHQALLRWVDAEDPAPATARTDLTDRLLEVPYRASYQTSRTTPLTLPEEVTGVKYPPARDPLAVIRSVEAKPSTTSPIPASTPTRVVFSDNIANRVRHIGAFAIKSRSTEPVETASFLIGVTDRGEVRYVIPQSSSGNTRLDAEAAQALGAMRLEHAAAAITWGHAAVQWGAEIYARAKPSTTP
jgi:hypothetical protein